jgi:arylsulfatase
MKSKTIQFGLRLFLAISWILLPAAVAATPPPPNLVIILADDLGFSDLGCYGGEIQTPNLDSLAADGLRFTQFYNTARCWPSRAAILTGYYAQHVRRDTVPGIRSGGNGVRPAWAPLLPQILKSQGYRTYHAGKWHIDGTTRAGGFDRSYRVEDHNRYFAPQDHFLDDTRLPPVPAGTPFYLTTAIADRAVEFLKEHDRRPDPFFLYLCFTAPHFPLQAPSETVARYHDRYSAGWNTVRLDRDHRLRQLGLAHHPLPPLEPTVGPPYPFPDALSTLGPGEVNRPIEWADLTAQQRTFQTDKMAIHAAMIDLMDQAVGRVLDQIRALNAWNNTLVLFLSDNGASAEIMVRGDGHDPKAPPGSAPTFLCLGPGWSSVANTPLRRHKTWVHEGGISTPLIAHWPNGIPARGQLRHTPAHLVDLAPTLVELAGGRWPRTWAGQPTPTPPGLSLVPAFARDRTIPRDSLWWWHEGNRALRIGDWKIVAAGQDAPWELYNLKTDRGETRNLADRNPKRLRDLARHWQTLTDSICALARQDVPSTAQPPRSP